MNADQLKTLAEKSVSTAGSVLKIALQSRRASSKGEPRSRELVIMGNGPSLRTTLDRDRDFLKERDLMAVNFAASAPEFKELKPEHYVLADGIFFSNEPNPNVTRLWENLAAVDRRMTLWVPWKHGAKVWRILGAHPHIEIKVFNMTPVEGFTTVTHRLMDLGLGMPRPRNVMIPSIMTAIREGYRKIWLVGADHTWTKTLDVDDENFVVSVQPHFYKDNEEEHRRVREAYTGLHLHDVLGSMTIAFRSYWQVAAYAREKGVEIVNATPGSMIDAFPRKLLSDRTEGESESKQEKL